MIKTFILVLSVALPGEPAQMMRMPQPTLQACLDKAKELLEFTPDLKTPFIAGAACFMHVVPADPA